MKYFILLIVTALVGAGFGVSLAYVAVAPAPAAMLEPRPDPPRPADLTADQSADVAAAPAPVATGPLARIDNPKHNFGTMQRGATLSHTFKLYNDGDAPLRPSTGNTSCKCTEFVAQTGAIPPGGVGDIKLEWAAKTLPGAFRQTAYLNTNDPYHSPIVLTVEGEVVEPAGLRPTEFNVGRIATEEKRELSVVLMAYDTDEIRLTAEKPDREGTESSYAVAVEPLEATGLPDPKATAGVRVNLTVGPGLPVGAIHDWVTLRTNLPGAEELQVPILGRVEGDLSIRGAGWSENTGVLALGMVASDQGKSARLRVSVKGPDAAGVQLEVAEVDPPELEVTLSDARKIRDGVYHVPLTVTVPKGTRPMVRLNNGRKPDGAYQHPEGLVRLTSNLPSTPEIQLRVRFAVGRGGR